MTEIGQSLRGRDFDGAGETLLVDKPLDWSSFDVIRYLRKKYTIRKIGHAGTLDPKATGLLIICTGPKTKCMHSFVDLEKEYTGVMELGVRTTTFDSEGAVVETRPCDEVRIDQIMDARQRFVGQLLQVPPMFSAAKYRGKPLYKLARKGRTVDREAKEIVVTQFDILSIRVPLIDFRIVCSKGTYIRSLVEEFGLALGTGATLRELRRTRIGNYHVSEAMGIDDLRGDS